MTNPPRITHPIPLAISVLVVGLSIVGCAGVGTGPAAPTLQVRVKPMLTVPWEAKNLSFTTMAASKSWRISPTLADIQVVMKEIGPGKVVLSFNFRQPYVIDEASGLRQAGAIVAGVGVSNVALLDVLAGKAKPPFALANNLQAVIDNTPDAPDYPATDTLYRSDLA